MTNPHISPIPFDRETVRKAMHAFAPHMTPYLLDGKYYCLSNPDWKTVIDAIGPDSVKYVADRYDCDSFSRWWWAEVNHRFEVNGMLIVADFDSKHSYNILLSAFGGAITPRVFEPQSLSFPHRGVKPYSLKRGFYL